MTPEKQELIRSLKVVYSILKDSNQLTTQIFNFSHTVLYFQFERNIKPGLKTSIVFNCKENTEYDGRIINPFNINADVIEDHNIKGIIYSATVRLFTIDEILAFLRTHMQVPLNGIKEIENYSHYYDSITLKDPLEKLITGVRHCGPLYLIPKLRFEQIATLAPVYDPPPTIGQINIYPPIVAGTPVSTPYRILNVSTTEYD